MRVGEKAEARTQHNRHEHERLSNVRRDEPPRWHAVARRLLQLQGELHHSNLRFSKREAHL